MLKYAIAVLLLIPAIGRAECGFATNSSEMMIVVSKKSDNKCFKSEEFRNAFREGLVASVKTMEANSPPITRAVARRPRPQGLPMPVQQAEMYYGQAPKR
ncbi:hypothetical protein [Noviherbaspirillum sp. ST9]|uniref:hypothetical protein n=1 Tax=Noviherbaspirillum sp. ST9 TaxID=3401606 RepID=UPI003B5883E5